MVKVYFVNGFLDAGKTTFINNLLSQDYFATGERTLLLLCEDGEEEFDSESLAKNNIFIAEIDDEKDFTPEFITNIEKGIKPKRVIVEFNGMWLRKNVEFPWYWDAPQDNPGTMIIGRFVMTCCAEDISLFGFICDFSDNPSLERDDWISLTAVVEKDYAEKYNLWYPVFRVCAFEKTEAPENEVIESI